MFMASGFVEEVHRRREEEGVCEVEVVVVCPHCGRRIDEPAYIEPGGPGGEEETEASADRHPFFNTTGSDPEPTTFSQTEQD